MHCENVNCYCQSEVGVLQDGRQFCSEHCLEEDASPSDLCRCGHAGCSTADELERAEGKLERA